MKNRHLGRQEIVFLAIVKMMIGRYLHPGSNQEYRIKRKVSLKVKMDVKKREILEVPEGIEGGKEVSLEKDKLKEEYRLEEEGGQGAEIEGKEIEMIENEGMDIKGIDTEGIGVKTVEIGVETVGIEVETVEMGV